MFLDRQAKNEELHPETLKAISKLRDEGKLTKTNLLRGLEVIRTSAIVSSAEKDSANG
jgi:hypothetical protein